MFYMTPYAVCYLEPMLLMSTMNNYTASRVDLRDALPDVLPKL